MIQFLVSNIYYPYSLCIEHLPPSSHFKRKFQIESSASQSHSLLPQILALPLIFMTYRFATSLLYKIRSICMDIGHEQ